MEDGDAKRAWLQQRRTEALDVFAQLWPVLAAGSDPAKAFAQGELAPCDDQSRSFRYWLQSGIPFSSAAAPPERMRQLRRTLTEDGWEVDDRIKAHAESVTVRRAGWSITVDPVGGQYVMEIATDCTAVSEALSRDLGGQPTEKLPVPPPGATGG